ncbi:MAG: class I SAM-dependent methyltransferase [Pyrinomonadaceae bacterium]
MAETEAFAYDRVLYPNYLHPQTHPDRLAAVAKVNGMEPADVEHCRVLELGCGTGVGLMSFAFGLPDSEFIGVDLSARQIDFGNSVLEEVGISNLVLRHGDIMELNRGDLGQFDFVIAHGLYAWTPPAVRDRILWLSRDILTPQGVAFVSYNTMPGGRFRQVVRDLMMFHARGFEDPNEKVRQSIGIVKFMSESALPDKIHKKVLEAELEALLERNVEGVFHDDLAEFFEPVYFRDFVEHASRHGLQYLDEAENFKASELSYPNDVLETIEGLAENRIDREQYLDFLNCRRFRQTLLCHVDAKLDRDPDASIINAFRVASHLTPASANPELVSRSAEKFIGTKSDKIETDHPLTKAALYHICSIWPRSAGFAELVAEAKRLLTIASNEFISSDDDEKILAEGLLRLFGTGLIHLHLYEPAFSADVSEFPEVSRLARWQAAAGEKLSTLRNESIKIDDAIGRELIKLLDGTRDRERLCSDLGVIAGQRIEPAMLDAKLAELAKLALFIA